MRPNHHPPNRRFQFSLRTALLAIGLFCLSCAAIRKIQFAQLAESLLLGGFLGAVSGGCWWMCRHRRVPINLEDKPTPFGALVGAASVSAAIGAADLKIRSFVLVGALTVGIAMYLGISIAVTVLGPKRP
jgi:hypothetical protein